LGMFLSGFNFSFCPTWARREIASEVPEVCQVLRTLPSFRD
jgi:hypothetical protein